MKRKPRGPKSRNLYAWRGSIWYERVADCWGCAHPGLERERTSQ